jgi:Mrp family chromosome partitioning ATPase
MTAASSSYASLERTLDRTIECLTGVGQAPQARALLIEARRLRSVVANWRSIPPPPDVHDEMLERVLLLSTAVGAALPAPEDEPEPEPEPEDDGEDYPEISTTDALGAADDDDIYSLDFEPHLYSLEGVTTTRREAMLPPAPSTRRASPRPPSEAPPRSPAVTQEPTTGARAAYAAIEGGGDAMGAAPLRPGWQTRPRASSVPAPAPQPARSRSSPPPSEPSESPLPAWALAALGPRAAAEPLVNGTAAAAPGTTAAKARRSSAPPQKSSVPAKARESVAPPAPAPAVTPPSASPPPVTPPPAAAPPATPAPLPGDDAPLPAREDGDLVVPRTAVTAHAVKLGEPVTPLLTSYHEPFSAQADAYRALRRKLVASGDPRVIGVTSAHPGEGKTVCALNLALTLRESARSPILVIEANLRSPILAKLLGITPPECFIAQIERHIDEPRAAWHAAELLPRLHVMAIDTSVKRDPMLNPVAFGAGMERLKQAGYEYILVDSPPVLGGVDCNVIADSMDGMLFAALSMKSLRKEMRRAVEQLEPAPILGVVVLET